MSPFEFALEHYSEDEIAWIMLHCLKNNGVVFCESDVFLCAFPTHSSLIKDKLHKCLDKADTWYVYIAAGNIKRVLEVAKPMKFLAYERFDKRIRIFDYEKYRRRYGIRRNG
jgi:hypothetical protein